MESARSSFWNDYATFKYMSQLKCSTKGHRQPPMLITNKFACYNNLEIGISGQCIL